MLFIPNELLILARHSHADEEVGDLYSQLESNIQFRKEVVERIGLGFELSSKKVVVGLNGPKRTGVPDVQLVASV
jgi:hypothetical protein